MHRQVEREKRKKRRGFLCEWKEDLTVHYLHEGNLLLTNLFKKKDKTKQIIETNVVRSIECEDRFVSSRQTLVCDWFTMSNQGNVISQVGFCSIVQQKRVNVNLSDPVIHYLAI